MQDNNNFSLITNTLLHFVSINNFIMYLKKKKIYFVKT